MNNYVDSEEKSEEINQYTSCINLQPISHKMRHSIDSASSQSACESIHISSSSSNSSSVNSFGVKKISMKTKEITDMVSNRLTAFVFMSQKCCSQSAFNSSVLNELESLKISLNDTLIACDDSSNQILVKSILEQILNLQKEFKSLHLRLYETQSEILNTETEELNLKEQMNTIESNINNFIIETQENKFKAGCSCLVF